MMEKKNVNENANEIDGEIKNGVERRGKYSFPNLYPCS